MGSLPLARWAVVQLAGRRILAPLIKVRVLAAQPTQLHSASPSSSRPRTTAFHAVDRGSNPLGDAKRIIAVILHGSAMQSLRFSFLSFPSRQAVSLLGGVLRLSALPFIFSAHSSHLTA